ncbi:hypothetical protein D9619_008472 [Psilocybe cf. subviscida]|uniref:Actin-like ATPase domain-containing protein n=1 Tax=Psilocybe cf. subviscida TaxID=2480587 RepID=A0A8H5B9H2_9AGAR|nr:hypothetical protein D9619_008472 [Psilocybe cf. subviscida]
MPAVSKTNTSLFLGIELGIDQLRASLLDETLELVGVECVDFDAELPEYQTQGGIFTTPGEAYTTPVEMWLKGLDALFEKLHQNYDLTKIKAIGGAAQHALVWWKSTTVPQFSSLDPHAPLHAQFPAHTFALPSTPVAADTSSQTHGVGIETALGGPDAMAARVGICANASMVAAQLLRVRETWPQEVWARTGRVQLASAFLASLVTGKWASMSEAEACATGAWVHTGGSAGGSATPNASNTAQGHWDETVLDIVGGSREEGRRVRGWLGDVDSSRGSKKAGNVSRYLVERYGFDPETVVAPFTSDYLSSYLSLLPSPGDAVLSFGPTDTLLAPSQRYTPSRHYSLLPHPAQDAGEKRKYVAVLTSRNADVPRALVRDMYTKSWSAFDRLVAIVPPGGSIGLDDKLFSFWHLQPDSHPFTRVKGIYRFETGIKVNEFRDLRANPRCLLESQVLSFRVKWSKLVGTGVLGGARKVSATPPPLGGGSTNTNARNSSALSTLGLQFDPYDHTPLPGRILATGAAANFPSVANLLGDVFNAPVFVPLTQIDSAQVAPHRNAPAQGYPSRAGIGAAYVARWIWSRERGTGGLGALEDEVKRLLGKRWIASGFALLRSNVNGTPSVLGGAGAGGLGGGLGLPGSGGNSGTSTPFGHRGALNANVVVEEDEDDLELDRNGHTVRAARMGMGLYGAPGYVGGELAARLRTQTASTGMSDSAQSGSLMPSTAYTTPDLGMQHNGGGSGTGTGGAATPTTPAPLTPIVALATSDAEAQLGIAKVAEADIDAFMTYAAIVPEYARLETMVVKGIV